MIANLLLVTFFILVRWQEATAGPFEELENLKISTNKRKKIFGLDASDKLNGAVQNSLSY